MCKIANCFSKENIAALSQQLSYSHFLELVAIKEQVKRDFYLNTTIESKWSLRQLREQVDKMLFERTALAKRPSARIAESEKLLSIGNISYP
jgi:predicted nuclease of restriction endonuclease-like (RecB) superfamily